MFPKRLLNSLGFENTMLTTWRKARTALGGGGGGKGATTEQTKRNKIIRIEPRKILNFFFCFFFYFLTLNRFKNFFNFFTGFKLFDLSFEHVPFSFSRLKVNRFKFRRKINRSKWRIRENRLTRQKSNAARNTRFRNRFKMIIKPKDVFDRFYRSAFTILAAILICFELISVDANATLRMIMKRDLVKPQTPRRIISGIIYTTFIYRQLSK